MYDKINRKDMLALGAEFLAHKEHIFKFLSFLSLFLNNNVCIPNIE